MELWDLLEQELMTVIAVITHPVGQYEAEVLQQVKAEL